VPVIIWINGGFGAGKTTLAEELHRRLPDAVVYDPEDVGLMLWKWLRPDGDFQHLPSWRELVVATALSLRRHHAETLIVSMSLIRDAYRAEILGGLADAGQEVLHVFLAADADVLRERLSARVTHPGLKKYLGLSHIKWGWADSGPTGPDNHRNPVMASYRPIGSRIGGASWSLQKFSTDHGAPPMTPAYVRRPTFRGRRDPTITGIR
jgi:AAA domain